MLFTAASQEKKTSKTTETISAFVPSMLLIWRTMRKDKTSEKTRQTREETKVLDKTSIEISAQVNIFYCRHFFCPFQFCFMLNIIKKVATYGDNPRRQKYMRNCEVCWSFVAILRFCLRFLMHALTEL